MYIFFPGLVEVVLLTLCTYFFLVLAVDDSSVYLVFPSLVEAVFSDSLYLFVTVDWLLVIIVTTN